MKNVLKLAPILSFVGLTFAATYSVELWLIQEGIRFDTATIQHTPISWLLLTMWIPGLVAIAICVFSENIPWRELRQSLGLRMGSIGPYIITVILAPAFFAVTYGLSWATGLTAPDLTFAALNQVAGTGAAITPQIVFRQMLPASVLLGPLPCFLAALGEEIGWRGFLLPRLMPLGKGPAYILVGLLWGLWHAPLIWVGFNYPGSPVAGIFMMCVQTSAFGLFLNEMTLHYRSVFLAAFIHGAINAQGSGIWVWLFPKTNPLLGGCTGVTAIVTWIVLGIVTIKILRHLQDTSIGRVDNAQ